MRSDKLQVEDVTRRDASGGESCLCSPAVALINGRGS